MRVKVLLYNADHIKRPHVFRVKEKKDTITKVARVFRPVAGMVLSLTGVAWSLCGFEQNSFQRSAAVAYIEEYNKRKLLTYFLRVS